MGEPPAAHRAYPDLHDHVRALEKAGQLIKVDRPINKDTEMHPLVRWQFRGGIPEKDRKAFLFTNIVDSAGRHYDIPVVLGALAANAAFTGPTVYELVDGEDPAPRLAADLAALNKAGWAP